MNNHKVKTFNKKMEKLIRKRKKLYESYKKIQENNNAISEKINVIEEFSKNIQECKQENIILQQNLQQHQDINLIENGKIKFNIIVSLDIDDLPSRCYIFKYKKKNIIQKGIYCIVVDTDELNENEYQHFELFATHYLLYKKPMFQKSDNDHKNELSKNYPDLHVEVVIKKKVVF